MKLIRVQNMLLKIKILIHVFNVINLDKNLILIKIRFLQLFYFFINLKIF